MEQGNGNRACSLHSMNRAGIAVPPGIVNFLEEILLYLKEDVKEGFFLPCFSL